MINKQDIERGHITLERFREVVNEPPRKIVWRRFPSIAEPGLDFFSSVYELHYVNLPQPI